LKEHHKKGLVEWLQVKVLSSNPSTERTNKLNNDEEGESRGAAGMELPPP
jgi:hypothetical protein